MHAKHYVWKDAFEDLHMTKVPKEIKKITLSEVFRIRLFVKRLGGGHDQLTRRLICACACGS